MRPNLLFGSIDSVLQYRVYLSIVVHGVLSGSLIAAWVAALALKPASAATKPA